MSSTFGLNGLQLAPSSVILYTLEFFDAITAGGRDKVDTLIASDSVAMIHDSRYVQFEELVEVHLPHLRLQGGRSFASIGASTPK